MTHSLFPARVRLIDVGPRDGLQNEAQAVPAAIKVELVQRLQTAGLLARDRGRQPCVALVGAANRR